MTPGNHSHEPRGAIGPTVSVIVPVRNGGQDLIDCLTALGRSSATPLEILVVDDGSTDDTATAARRMGAEVLVLEENHGPAYARNRGAERARGEILFFCDADVLIHPDTIAWAARTLDPAAVPERDVEGRELPRPAAVIGSYDETPASPGFVALYKNLFHHWVHQHARTEASTFWTGCGAVRRDVFLRAGGFQEGYRRPSIEDIELGFRLRRAGHRIRLEKRMLATHTKRWRLGNLLYTDVFLRGAPWIALMLRDRYMPMDLNLSAASKVATVFSGLLVLSILGLLGTAAVSGGAHLAALAPTLALVVATWLASRIALTGVGAVRALAALSLCIGLPTATWIAFPDPWAALPLGLWFATALTHVDLYAFFGMHRGLAFALGAAPLHILFQLCCAASVPFGYLEFLTHRRRATRASEGPGIQVLEPLDCRRDDRSCDEHALASASRLTEGARA